MNSLPITQELMPYEAKLREAQRLMKTLPQTFIPVQHFFGGGMYTRVMFAPAGTAIIGKKHLQEQHNFLMLGSIRLVGEDGGKTIHAPEVIVSPAGTKRAAIALTDVIWATTLKTDATNPDDVERECIDPLDVDESLKIEKEKLP